MDAFKDRLSKLVSTFNPRKLTDKVHPHSASHGAAPYPGSHLGPSKGGKKRTRRVKSKKSKSKKSRKSRKSRSSRRH
jgi:hypothetical protein